MKNLKIRLVKNKKELKQIFKIRKIVLKKEKDELDKNAKQIIVLYKNKPIGCARIRFMDKKAEIERMSILKEYRGKGFGRALLNYTINFCKKKKIKEIVLLSFYHARDFYKKYGFKPKGKTFTSEGIKHIEMCLKP